MKGFYTEIWLCRMSNVDLCIDQMSSRQFSQQLSANTIQIRKVVFDLMWFVFTLMEETFE